jgi:tRNA(fMet)-specific endonuclease VapC
MTYLVDSDYIADYLVEKPRATELLSSLAPHGIAISILSVGEIYEGIYYGYNPEKAARQFQRFLKTVSTIPLTARIMQQFARIRGELRWTGRIIGDFDILIASTAIQHHLTLLTRNTRDYQRIPDLKLYKAA